MLRIDHSDNPTSAPVPTHLLIRTVPKNKRRGGKFIATLCGDAYAAERAFAPHFPGRYAPGSKRSMKKPSNSFTGQAK